jgi:hypothetical protein
LKKRHFIPSLTREANSFAAFIQPQDRDSHKRVPHGYWDVLRRLIPVGLVCITLRNRRGKWTSLLRIHLLWCVSESCTWTASDLVDIFQMLSIIRKEAKEFGL